MGFLNWWLKKLIHLTTDLYWGQNHAVGGLSVLAVMVEGLEQEFRSGGWREVETHNLHVGQSSQSGEQSHGLSGARRSAQHFNKPFIY